jgi:hypothetical protein
MQRPL